MNYGRIKIKTKYRDINILNIGMVLSEAYMLHQQNIADMDFLYAYYKGNQEILQRTKKIRPEICNKIVENHANSIVQFKTGYLLERPIQYVARKNDVVGLENLNDFMIIENKEEKDKEIANDSAICGVAERIVLPNKNYVNGSEESPFNIYTINPTQAFVIYSSGIGEEPLVGVVIYQYKSEDEQTHTILQAYTKDEYFEFDNSTSTLIKNEKHSIGYIPVVEYPYNKERMGAFEPIIPILNAINTIQSNRVDGVEQFIQAIMVFKNVEVTKEMLALLKELGAINIEDNGDVEASIDYLQQELNQTQVQILKNDLLENAFKIVSMPLGNNHSGDDSGTAVIMRDGWSECEARTQETELMFKASERNMLKIVLSYMKTLVGTAEVPLLSDIDIKFTRRNYENVYQKALVLDILLKNGKVAPRLAFETCGLFSDSEIAYKDSEEYVAEMERKANELHETNQGE